MTTTAETATKRRTKGRTRGFSLLKAYNFLHTIAKRNTRIKFLNNLFKDFIKNKDNSYSTGGDASFLNSGALNAINSELTKALHKTDSQKDIEI